MLRSFVRCGGFGRAIDFDEDKARRLVLPLQHVKTSNARLFPALADILNGGSREILKKFSFHPDVNVDGEHRF